MENSTEDTTAKGKPKARDPFDIFGDISAMFQSIGLDFDTGFDFGEMSSPSAGGSPAAASRAASPFAPSSPLSAASPATPVSPQASRRSEPATASQTAPQTSAQNGSGLGRKALGVAEGEAARGVQEEPKGSNDGPRVREYQRGSGGNYWCAHFVSWCVNQAGSSPFGHTGSVATLRKWGQNNGRYTPVSQAHPQPGDIFTKSRTDKQGRVVGGHTGFVLDYDPKGRRMRTVEGNSQDRVRIGSQSMSNIDGIIRI